MASQIRETIEIKEKNYIFRCINDKCDVILEYNKGKSLKDIAIYYILKYCHLGMTMEAEWFLIKNHNFTLDMSKTLKKLIKSIDIDSKSSPKIGDPPHDEKSDLCDFLTTLTTDQIMGVFNECKYSMSLHEYKPNEPNWDIICL